MTPEEKFDSEIWWVLKQLKYVKISKSSNEDVTKIILPARPIIPEGTPSIYAQQKAIYKIEELGGIKVLDERIEIVTYGKDFIYTLEFLQPTFDKLYNLYKNTFGKATEKEVTPAPKMEEVIKVIEKELEENRKEEAIADRVIEKLKVADTQKVQSHNNRPYCIVEGKKGFLKFSKQSKGIEISNTNSQPFRLLQCLTEPSCGIAKTVDTVFEAIREGVKYKSKKGVYTSATDKAQKIKLIEYAIKELQKGNKLQGKLLFKWDDPKRKVWLEHLNVE